VHKIQADHKRAHTAIPLRKPPEPLTRTVDPTFDMKTRFRVPALLPLQLTGRTYTGPSVQAVLGRSVMERATAMVIQGPFIWLRSPITSSSTLGAAKVFVIFDELAAQGIHAKAWSATKRSRSLIFATGRNGVC
jgi:hypothetical protein